MQLSEPNNKEKLKTNKKKFMLTFETINDLCNLTYIVNVKNFFY